MIRKLPFLFLALSLSACSFDKEQSSETNEQEEAPQKILTFETKDLTKTAGDCSSDTSVYCTEVSFKYPEFSSTEEAPKINESLKTAILSHYLTDSVNTSFEGFSDMFITDYKTVSEKFGESFGWYAAINSNVKRHDTTVLVIETAVSTYTGGAHGMEALYYINFNPQTGEQLKLKDVFKPGYEDELEVIAQNAFKKMLENDPRDFEVFEFEENTFYNENFGLLDDGVTFYFNVYEIAPYASGPSQITIPYSQLQSILKDGQGLVM